MCMGTAAYPHLVSVHMLKGSRSGALFAGFFFGALALAVWSRAGGELSGRWGGSGASKTGIGCYPPY